MICHCCGAQLALENEPILYEGNYLCHHCWVAITGVTCCDCQCVRRVNQMVYFNGFPYCIRCAKKPNWKMGKDVIGHTFDEIGSKRRYGVELEVHQCSHHHRLRGKTCFGAKDDGTRGVSKEFVSPILQGDEGLRAIRDLCDNSKGFTVNHTCGYHLHIDCTDLTEDQCKSVALAYNMTYEVWASFVNQKRRDNRYCKMHEWSYYDILNYSWNNLLNNIYTRYTWANWDAYKLHHTLEIRLHPGTLDKGKIINWVKAHLRFVDYFLKFTPQQTYNMLNDLNNDQLFEFTCDIWNDSKLSKYYKRRSKHYGLAQKPVEV